MTAIPTSSHVPTRLERDPFAYLGPHQDASGDTIVIRVRYPAAERADVRIVETGVLHPMTRMETTGVFELRRDLPDRALRSRHPS